jgi:hypothetical protein
MYDCIYEKMADYGIATKMNTERLFSKEGLMVETEEEAFGLKSYYLMTRPDKLIFVDEVGSNTSQAKDGNVGGEKFLCKKGSRPQQRSSTQDAHFTVLGFTAATGEAVLCAIIFAAKELEEQWVLGLDPQALWIGDKDNLEGNTGEGKRYPQGPVCNINGKEVPTFCCCSESGSITGDLLVEMLRHIDKYKVFDRADGIDPFLILDGHGSRFELPFLEYINKPIHKWNVCIGVPYGTSIWQVGDSTEQNGCYKMSMTKAKRELLTKKERAYQKFTIDKMDVVYLVRRVWKDSFARVLTNKKAIAERGWNPLNHVLLLHPEIQLTNKTATTASSTDPASDTITTVQPESLNLTEGLAGTLMDQIVEFRNREDSRNGVNLEEQALRRQETSQANIDEHRGRLTAGLLASSGQFALGPTVLDNMRARKRKAEDAESARQKKKQKECEKQSEKVQAVRLLNKQPDEWTVAQLKTMVTWLKEGTDPSPPTTKALLLTRYFETFDRPDPLPPFPEATELPPPFDDALPPDAPIDELQPPPDTPPQHLDAPATLLDELQPPPDAPSQPLDAPATPLGDHAPANPPDAMIPQPPLLSESDHRKQQEYEKQLEKVQAIRSLNKQPEEWTVSQIITMVKWYKDAKDLARPSTKTLLLTRYYETFNRPEPPPPFPSAPELLPPFDDSPPTDAPLDAPIQPPSDDQHADQPDTPPDAPPQ